MKTLDCVVFLDDYYADRVTFICEYFVNLVKNHSLFEAMIGYNGFLTEC